MENITSGLNSFSGEQGQFTKNQAKLWVYLLKLPKHPKVNEHKGIASSLGVVNYRPIFRGDAERRLLETITQEPTTAATISQKTGIAHKYLCLLKSSLEEKGLIEVIGLVTCPTTNSRNVQLLAPTRP